MVNLASISIAPTQLVHQFISAILEWKIRSIKAFSAATHPNSVFGAIGQIPYKVIN
jgi:hypothetical protein